MTTDQALAQDPDEPFDVLLADGTPTGLVKPRAAIHRDGDWHRALHLWIAGEDTAGVPFLTFQRRAAGKDTWPGRLDTTVGGHFRAGESLADTLREVEEEIGVDARGLELRFLGVRVCANEAEPGIIDRELQEVYLLCDNRPLEAYRPNPVELAELTRFPLESLLPFLAGETQRIQGRGFSPGASTVTTRVVTLNDFIPTVDRYNLRVAIAARNALRGDPFVAV